MSKDKKLQERIESLEKEISDLEGTIENLKWVFKQLINKDYYIQQDPTSNQQRVIAYMIAIANGVYPYFHESFGIFPKPENIKFTKKQFEQLNNRVDNQPLLTGPFFEYQIEDLIGSRDLCTNILVYIWLTHGFNNPIDNKGDISKWDQTLDNFKNHESASWEAFTKGNPNEYKYDFNKIIHLSYFL